MMTKKTIEQSTGLSPVQLALDHSEHLSSDEEGRTRGSTSSGAKSSEDAQHKSKEKTEADVVFTDKGRAAAVVSQGELDIALVDRRDRGKLLKEGKEEPPPPKDAVLFHCEAIKFLRCGHFGSALHSVNQALRMLATEKKEWLLTKAFCHFRLFQLNESLRDIQSILEKDPVYFPAICLKARALYFTGELEQSLLCYIRGIQLKPTNIMCTRGILGLEKAIEEQLTSSCVSSRIIRPTMKKFTKCGKKTRIKKYVQDGKNARKLRVRNRKNKKIKKLKEHTGSTNLRSSHQNVNHLDSDRIFLENISGRKEPTMKKFTKCGKKTRIKKYVQDGKNARKLRVRNRKNKKIKKLKEHTGSPNLRSSHQNVSHLDSDRIFLENISGRKVLFGCAGDLDLKERAQSVLRLIREAREFVCERQQFCIGKQQP